MEIARLVLDYTQALIWPIVVIVILAVLRDKLPSLIERARSFKFPGGTEIQFDTIQAQAAGTAADKIAAATTQAASDQRGTPITSSDIDMPQLAYSSGYSASKIFRNLRLSLLGVIEQVEIDYNLRPIKDGAVRSQRRTGVLIDPPRWDDLVASLRRLSYITDIEGWAELADAVVAMQVFASQPGPPALRSMIASLLSRSANATAQQLAERSIRTEPSPDTTAKHDDES